MHLVKSISFLKRNGSLQGFLFLFFILFTAHRIQAQNTNEHFFDIDSTRIKDSLAKLPPKPAYDYEQIPVIGFTQIISNDYMFGFSFGFMGEKRMIETRLNFEFRPFFKSSQVKENDTLVYQYRQKEYMLSLSVEKQFGHMLMEKHISPYFQLNGGYAWGNYRGWEKNPQPKWFIAPGVGACYFISRNAHVKLGYQYFKPITTSSKPHHVYLQILLYI